jgi:DNA-binding MarR family transcriptional regulator
MDEPGPNPVAQTTPALVQALARSAAGVVAAAFAEHGFTDLRPAHAPLLVPLLGGAGRANDLAERMGVSRQAVAQVVTTLERGGYVVRVPDPADARAKLICLTKRGRAALKVMRGCAEQAEAEWVAQLGEARVLELRAILLELLGPGAGTRPAAR